MTIRFENPLRLMRELGPTTWIVLSVLIQSKDQGSVNQAYIETWTGLTDKPVSRSLTYLVEIGLVDRTRSGWQLKDGDHYQLGLPLILETGQEPAAADTVEADKPDQDPPSRNNSDSQSLEVEVNLTNSFIDSSSDSLKTDQVGKIPTDDEIRRVLDAAAELFGHEIQGDTRDYKDLDRLLTWICQAWNRRGSGPGRVTSPAGLVYWAFHKGRDRPPEKKYQNLEIAERWVPESFMRRSGQWNFEDDDSDDM